MPIKKGKKKSVTTKKITNNSKPSRKTTTSRSSKNSKTTRAKSSKSNSRARTKAVSKRKRNSNRKIKNNNYKIKKVEKIIHSVALDQDFKVRNYQIRFKENDYIDMTDLANRNIDELYKQLEPHFTKIFKTIKKHPVFFVSKILYFDLFPDAISHSRQDIEMMPDEFYLKVRDLCALMVSKAEAYDKRAGGSGLDITGVEFQTYFNPNKKNPKKAVRKKKAKKKK